MELVYETEMNEKGAAKLFLRRRGFLKGLREFFATLSVLWPVGAIYYLLIMRDGGRINITEFLISILGTLFFLFCFFIVDRVVVQKVRRAYRQRKTNQVEYRLTNDKLAFTVGETTFSSPWNKVAKKFRIDRKAIYLYGKDLPFEAQCIPEWRGHGVERKELVAMLKKAGLKKMISGWLKSLMGLAVTFVLITCYFYIGGIEWGDWTIPDEAELRLEKRDVPDEDNAYIALMSLTNLYHVADDDQEEKSDGDSVKAVSDKDFVRYYGDPFNSENKKERALVCRDPASPKRAEQILAANTKFFDAFRAALSFKYFVNTDARLEDAKRAREGKPPSGAYLLPYKPLIDFVRLIELRAQVALEKGDVESAVSAISEIHALGQLVMVNNESIVAYLVGVLIERISYKKMRDSIAMGKTPVEVLALFDRMVDASEASAQLCWARAIKAELAFNVRTLEWVCDLPKNDWACNVQLEDFARKYRETLKTGTRWPGLFGFIFHRREMVFRTTEYFRSIIAHEEPEIKPREWWVVFTPNLAGRILVDSLCPSFEQFFRERSLCCIKIHLVIAAEKWRRAHGGENPPSLDVLVPDYLASVPKDPWSKSGEPIKYDASTGVAWSVGKDCKYDYREVAKKLAAAGNTASVDDNTQKYAFRLDGKPVNSKPDNVGGVTKHPVRPQIVKDNPDSTTQSQYAAEAIPVIAILRTKIGLYQYEKGVLPCIATNDVAKGKDTGKVSAPQIETWVPVDSETAATVSAPQGSLPCAAQR